MSHGLSRSRFEMVYLVSFATARLNLPSASRVPVKHTGFVPMVGSGNHPLHSIVKWSIPYFDIIVHKKIFKKSLKSSMKCRGTAIHHRQQSSPFNGTLDAMVASWVGPKMPPWQLRPGDKSRLLHHALAFIWIGLVPTHVLITNSY